MKEIKVKIADVPAHEANALLICDCGSVLHFNLLEVKQYNEMLVTCDKCKQEILVIDVDGPNG